MTQQLIPIYEGLKQVGWKHPDTGVYTPAVRCDPPGQPISSDIANVDVLIQRLRAANAGGLREQAYQSLCGDAADALSRASLQPATDGAARTREPDAWQYRMNVGGWLPWHDIDMPMDYFLKKHQMHLDNGSCEVRPLYCDAAQPSWQPIETAPFVSAKRYLIVDGSEVPLIGFRYYREGLWYDEHGHEVSPLAWQELPSYSIPSTPSADPLSRPHRGSAQ